MIPNPPNPNFEPTGGTPSNDPPLGPRPPSVPTIHLPKTAGSPSPPFLVFGLNVVVRMLKDEEVLVPVQCPRGQPVQYGVVVSAGDGFDPQAIQFRAMPPVGATVAFEETTEGIEGHYLFVGDDEFRVLHLDVITIGFPPK